MLFPLKPALSAFSAICRASKSGDKLICLEAENYNDIFWQGVGQETTSSEDLLRNMENRGKRKAYSDPQASGGKYIERMTLATYYFGVADPGKYTIWYRFYMPRKANWQFNQHLSRVGKEDVKLNGRSNNGSGRKAAPMI